MRKLVALSIVVLVAGGGVATHTAQANSYTKHCKSYTGNRYIGCILAAKKGWYKSEFISLEKLWTFESGWSQWANNPMSDACGIAQQMDNCAYGYSVWVQIHRGLKYIEKRYHTPTDALGHFYSYSWY